ncbi:cupin [Meridianimaribacter sp. CL38]|uniref:cupin domain-containing protein n=1 Tax=Meridianimaribacter sp. CL38 TaxID=2213021 RepID=UPI00103AD974|nr:cupin domain-containing protein [Meridianimaribacter sp. CL38]TBV27639.1 cupin [Meridianimaribacter sp. CL38]
MKRISAFLVVALALNTTFFAQNNSNKELTIEQCVNTLNVENSQSTKVGYQYWFADKEFLDGRTLKLSVVEPHKATHEPHKHEEDEFFFVLEGTAEFFLNGETVVAGPYTSFYCPPNSLHGIRNVGDTELKYLVIKKYNLSDK